jgi:plasmid stabilization system protein ParE
VDFKIIWSDAALADLQDIWTYVAEYDPQAADRIGRGILAHVRILASFPFIGPLIRAARKEHCVRSSSVLTASFTTSTSSRAASRFFTSGTARVMNLNLE